MRTRNILLGLGLGLLLVASAPTTARSASEFETGNLRGRYTGHLNVGASFTDGTVTQRLDIQFLAALKFDGKSSLDGAGRVTISIPGEPPRTCPFAITGTYALEETGLGTATLVLVPTDETCGDGSGVTLDASLLLGGQLRRRLDVTINGGTEPNGQSLPIVGSGTLEK